MKKINIKSPEDAKAYIAYLSKVSKEVDQWPPEKKTRRATVFHEDFKRIEQNKSISKDNKK